MERTGLPTSYRLGCWQGPGRLAYPVAAYETSTTTRTSACRHTRSSARYLTNCINEGVAFHAAVGTTETKATKETATTTTNISMTVHVARSMQGDERERFDIPQLPEQPSDYGGVGGMALQCSESSR